MKGVARELRSLCESGDKNYIRKREIAGGNIVHTNKRTISIGKLRTESLAYLSGFFGEVVTRGEMIMLQESASESGAKRIGSGAWNSFLREGTPIRSEPLERDTFARDSMRNATDHLLSAIRWRYGRQCRLFMEGYLDGLPEHIPLFDALEMMKRMAPSYFKGSAA